MAKSNKNGKKDRQKNRYPKNKNEGENIKEHSLHPEAKKSILGIGLLGIALVLLLASFQKAGPVGNFSYQIFNYLFGIGFYLLPAILIMLSAVFLISERRPISRITFIGALIFILSSLGLIDVLSPGESGLVGKVCGSIEALFGYTASIIITIFLVLISLIIVFNTPLKIKWPKKILDEEPDEEEETLTAEEVDEIEETVAVADAEQKKGKEIVPEISEIKPAKKDIKVKRSFANYVPPPLELLKSSFEKPTSGDLRANANIIKRTLESFGISVEMGEINIGPKVTRYTLKPAEGVKLSRITALNQDLSLALAAHPIRIEAPIPGKSLVGIEVPNKAAAVVRLGSLMTYPEVAASGNLGFVLGRDVTGEPIMANIAKMPHLLIAGATGSGKSIALHSLIISLLYKNSPETLKFIMIDPKRVELSVYEGIPHLVAPVVTQTKKAVGVFRWAISEMDKRYEILLGAGCRDVESYNKKNPGEPLSYVIIVIDELADLMATYGREVEGSIVRLAQMARATGLHLVVSTQRPSVEVITGLIKANITSRMALQVASQIDSRTILDMSGAEKLLGGGDMLFISAEFSKPKRIQGAYVSEEEIEKVATFIREHNKEIISEEESPSFENGSSGNSTNGENKNIFDEYQGKDDEDDLYEEAVKVVSEAKKASASLLQRRLSVGYARAARLLDIMEARGIIGPGDGAKPREVYMERTGGPTDYSNDNNK